MTDGAPKDEPPVSSSTMIKKNLLIGSPLSKTVSMAVSHYQKHRRQGLVRATAFRLPQATREGVRGVVQSMMLLPHGVKLLPQKLMLPLRRMNPLRHRMMLPEQRMMLLHRRIMLLLQRMMLLPRRMMLLEHRMMLLRHKHTLFSRNVPAFRQNLCSFIKNHTRHNPCRLRSPGTSRA